MTVRDGTVSDERLARFAETCRAMGDAGDGARYDWWDGLAQALTELLARRSVPSEPVAWRFTTADINGELWSWDFTGHKSIMEQKWERGLIVEPLFTSPPTKPEVTPAMVESAASNIIAEMHRSANDDWDEENRAIIIAEITALTAALKVAP